MPRKQKAATGWQVFDTPADLKEKLSSNPCYGWHKVEKDFWENHVLKGHAIAARRIAGLWVVAVGRENWSVQAKARSPQRIAALYAALNEIGGL